jgi:Antitoxin Xre/MbcA/ParS C-terminal toxin-binding domain/Antitoxin Xre-like helix-turn-helix domain
LNSASCHLATNLLSLAIWQKQAQNKHMAVLTQIKTEASPFNPEPITDEEAAAMFRAALNLFKVWGVRDDQAAILLGLMVRTYRRWKKDGKVGQIGRDGKARLSNLMGIHKSLRITLRDGSRGYAWIKAHNAAFGGRSALDVMLGGELTDLMRVRRYLDAERGAW